VPVAAKPVERRPPPNIAIPAAAAPALVADADSPGARPSAKAPVPSSAPPKARPMPKGGVAMPGISDSHARDFSGADPGAGERAGRSRPGASAPASQTYSRSEPNAKLRGVPLGALPACRTDKLEDDLKQKVIAAVRSPRECTSSAGRYSFVETKNLNAFLMMVERSANRAEVDRCAELAYALSCLKSGGAR
jgi:hypothetical protein